MHSIIDYNQYSVEMSYNTQNLFIHIRDNITYKCYEKDIKLENIKIYFILLFTEHMCYTSIFEPDDISISIHLLQIYNLLESSLKIKDEYNNLVITINDEIMTLSFNGYIYGTSFQIDFTILIEENKMIPNMNIGVIPQEMNRFREVDVNVCVTNEENALINHTNIVDKEKEPIGACNFNTCLNVIFQSYLDKIKLE